MYDEHYFGPALIEAVGEPLYRMGISPTHSVTILAIVARAIKEHPPMGSLNVIPGTTHERTP